MPAPSAFVRPPLRCYTCGKVMSEVFDAFARMAADGRYDHLAEGDLLDLAGAARVCCRATVLTHLDVGATEPSLVANRQAG